MSHGNARTTFHGRLLIVQRRQQGWRQAHIAAAMGVSRKCVKTWIDRYAAEGEAGLADRSSRPHTMPARTSAEVEQQVLAARREHRRGQDWLGPELGVAPRTVNRILSARRHTRLRDHHLRRLGGRWRVAQHFVRTADVSAPSTPAFTAAALTPQPQQMALLF